MKNDQGTLVRKDERAAALRRLHAQKGGVGERVHSDWRYS